jgi:hypothetical protein
MTATAELIAQARKLSGEVIPQGGTEADTRFTNAEVTAYITAAVNLSGAVADLWEAKAGFFQAEIGSYKAVGAGNEQVTWYTPKEQMDICLKMAESYREKSNREALIDKAVSLGLIADKAAGATLDNAELKALFRVTAFGCGVK